MAKAPKKINKETDGLADAISDLASDAVEVSMVNEKGHTVILGNMDRRKNRLESSKTADAPRREVIKKANIIDGRKLDCTIITDTASGILTDNKKCPWPVHQDLIKAFKALDEHLGRLCFQPLTEHNPAHKENKELPALICPIHCIGFAVTGSEEKEAVTLKGYRMLPNAKDIDLISPSQQYNDDIYNYEQADELAEAVMSCIGEVELYLFPSAEWPNCKHEPDNQLSLFPESENEDDGGEDEDDKTEE